MSRGIYLTGKSAGHGEGAALEGAGAARVIGSRVSALLFARSSLVTEPFIAGWCRLVSTSGS